MNWRAFTAGCIIATAISIATGIIFWPSLLLAGIALGIDSIKNK
jgi:hypothetical protein